jgi:hypothetical protein
MRIEAPQRAHRGGKGVARGLSLAGREGAWRTTLGSPTGIPAFCILGVGGRLRLAAATTLQQQWSHP